MIIKKLENKDGFTNNEKIIADYILLNLEKIHSFSAENLAKNSYTSKASVIRLCKKLNINGYREFQRQIDKEINEMNKIYKLLTSEPVNNKTTYEEIVDIIPTLYEKVIGDTKLNLDKEKMKKIILKLKKSKKIEIYGVGISYTIAKLTAFKFNTLGIESEAHDGINEHYIISSKKGKGDLAIVISLSGNNPYMIRSANYLKEKGVYVIGIGNGITKEIKEACSDYIEIHAPKYILSFEILSAFTGINYVLDIFYTSLLVENYYKNIETSIEVNGKSEY